MEKKPYLLNVKGLRQILIMIDDIMHFLVAIILLACAALILARTIPSLFNPEIKVLLHVVNDVLLVLIIMELMWPIMRFLKREAFTLNPFLYIGIISSIRRILMLEAEHSIVAQTAGHKAEWATLWPVLAEMGVYVAIIFVLAVALRIISGRKEQVDA
ncbi:MAG: hypothetical protein KKG35_13140 [Proteobacteria bacterium]|nr:hypothetical protein [Pseudomonadota bacterium]